MPNTVKPPKGAVSGSTNSTRVKHRRRFCRIEGCSRIVKSQGVCQRHGAKPRLCKVDGCKKQAQGNFDKMCKAHFKEMKRRTTPIPKVDTSAPPAGPEGESVYDTVLPLSIAYVPTPETSNPLVAHLKDGFDQLKPPAWHRNEERRARGLVPIENPALQLEGWERELVWMEILVLTGAPKASFRHLARAWGRDKGFHKVLAQFICERQGEVQRKPRQQNNTILKSKPKKQSQPKKIPDPFSDDSFLEDFGDDENAFADDIFNFTVEEFEGITSKWSNAYAEQVSSSSTADTPAESLPSLLQEEEDSPSGDMEQGLTYDYQQPPQQEHYEPTPHKQGTLPPELERCPQQQQKLDHQLHLIPPNNVQHPLNLVEQQ